MSAAAADRTFDVAVVGGGVVGCAVARLLSHHHLRVALVEARADVGVGTSKANTAILHTGFDVVPGSAEARPAARGYELCTPMRRARVSPGGGDRRGPVVWDDEQKAAEPAEAARQGGAERI